MSYFVAHQMEEDFHGRVHEMQIRSVPVRTTGAQSSGYVATFRAFNTTDYANYANYSSVVACTGGIALASGGNEKVLGVSGTT